MSLWLVRAGKYGEQEQGCLDNNVITIGWNELPDLSNLGVGKWEKDKEEFKKIYAKTYPNASNHQVSYGAGQIWYFVHGIKKGDYIALPLKSQSAIALGQVIGEYEYKPITDNIKHIRKVKWLKTVARSEFDEDILKSFNALFDVCMVMGSNKGKANDAENRIKKLLEGKGTDDEQEKQTPEEPLDIERHAKDQIIKHIEANFKGHNLARLVDAILRAQGFITWVSPPGPDGGVDILATGGLNSLEKPKICVQVKSSVSPCEVKVVNELIGVVTKHKADQGLLVSWGGVTKQALKEVLNSFFTIRVWNQDSLVDEIFKYYDKFDEELKAELPLKRIWTLVREEE